MGAQPRFVHRGFQAGRLEAMRDCLKGSEYEADPVGPHFDLEAFAAGREGAPEAGFVARGAACRGRSCPICCAC